MGTSAFARSAVRHCGSGATRAPSAVHQSQPSCFFSRRRSKLTVKRGKLLRARARNVTTARRTTGLFFHGSGARLRRTSAALHSGSRRGRATPPSSQSCSSTARTSRSRRTVDGRTRPRWRLRSIMATPPSSRSLPELSPYCKIIDDQRLEDPSLSLSLSTFQLVLQQWHGRFVRAAAVT